MAQLNKTQEWVLPCACIKHHRFDETENLVKGWSRSRTPQSHKKFLREITLDRVRGDTESQLIYSIFSAVRSPQFFTPSPVNFLNLPLHHSSWLLFSKLPVKSQQKIFRIIPEVPPKQQDQNRTIICRMSKFKKPFMQLKYIYIINFSLIQVYETVWTEQNQTLFPFITLSKYTNWGKKHNPKNL